MLVFAMFFQLTSAMSETPENLCNKKNITCSDLNYTDSYSASATCTPCPIVSENKYSCISRSSGSLTSLSIDIKQAGAKVCEKLPSCADLGYQITKENAAKVSTIYSCSACPLDGNYWACAHYGLKK
jgi:hypothetical protein